MVKPFLFSLLVLVSLVVGMLGHYYSYDRESIDEHLSKIVHLTQSVSPSFAVKYYEPRVLLYERSAHPSYPEMPAINRMDFVYAQ